MHAKVLVAEDELLIALDIIDELAAAGFGTIGPFATRSDALDYCRAEKPDCAVLDVRLQDGDCYPLADYLVAQRIPIVFHSGHANKRALAERYRDAAAAVCPKPSPTAQIAALVEKLCRRALGEHGGARTLPEASYAMSAAE
jgi:two-component system, response regulator PdtaR